MSDRVSANFSRSQAVIRTWTRVIPLTGLLALAGCQTVVHNALRITSKPTGAPVEVDGVSVGATPLDVPVVCHRTWVGLINSPDGWQYFDSAKVVTAYPTKDSQGPSQKKVVNTCSAQGSGWVPVHFDLDLIPVAPRSDVRLTVTQQDPPSTADTTTRSLQNLRQLKAAGVLSDEDYKKAVLKALDQDKPASPSSPAK